MLAISLILGVVCASFLKCYASTFDDFERRRHIQCPPQEESLALDYSPVSVADLIVQKRENITVVPYPLEEVSTSLNSYRKNSSKSPKAALTSTTFFKNARDEETQVNALPLTAVSTAMIDHLSRTSSIAEHSHCMTYSQLSDGPTQEDELRGIDPSPFMTTALDDFLVMDAYNSVVGNDPKDHSYETLTKKAKNGNCLARCAIVVLCERDERKLGNFGITPDEIRGHFEDAYPDFLLYQNKFEPFEDWDPLLRQFLRRD